MIAFVDTSTSRAASHQRKDSGKPGITARQHSPEGDAESHWRRQKQIVGRSQLFERLKSLVERLSDVALEQINGSLPINHVGWAQFSLHMAERFVSVACRAAAAGGSQAAGGRNATCRRFASALSNLSIRLSKVGRSKEPLTASWEATDIIRAQHHRKRTSLRSARRRGFGSIAPGGCRRDAPNVERTSRPAVEPTPAISEQKNITSKPPGPVWGMARASALA
jgi:hypothetical protein